MQLQLMRVVYLTALIAALVFIGDDAIARDNVGQIKLLVVPRVSPDASAASVEFRLRYDGPASISASVASLPGERLFYFASLRAERFSIYDADPFIRCPQPKERIFIDDPGVGYKSINPGQELVQTIDLFKLYDNLGEILGKCDFVVYWSHKVEIEGAYKAPRMAGAIVFPATLDVVAPKEDIGRIHLPPS